MNPDNYLKIIIWEQQKRTLENYINGLKDIDSKIVLDRRLAHALIQAHILLHYMSRYGLFFMYRVA